MRHHALVGQKVADRYTVKRFLGEGGMATVYVAEQDDEPREIALKIMNKELMVDRTFVRRFQREAKAASRVQHPNSVQIIGYGVEGGISFIAMELLIGDDLYVLLEREGALTQARSARILIEVCDALMVAHDLGIVHRDLKPENIMVIADPTHPNGERVKVLDFGIAKLLSADSATEGPSGPDSRLDPPSAVTRAGTFIGTPAYMSPEQCALLPVDTRADIYTCGVLLFQLLTGRLPFEGQTPLHTATLHLHQAPPAPSSLAPKIDPRLEALLLKALSKKPTERHQTARHLGSSLRKMLPDLPDIVIGSGAPISRAPGSTMRPPGGTHVGGASAPGPQLESMKTMLAEQSPLHAPAPVFVHPPSEPPPSMPANSDPPARIRYSGAYQATHLNGSMGAPEPIAPGPNTQPSQPDQFARAHPQLPAPYRDEPEADSSDSMQTLVRPSFTEMPAYVASSAAGPLRVPTPYPGSSLSAQMLPGPPRTTTDPLPKPIVLPPMVHATTLTSAAARAALPAVAPTLAAPVAPPAQPHRAAPMAFAETLPAMAAPQAPYPMAPAPAPPAAPPAQLAQLSGARGLLIGFLFGVLIVGILLLAFALLRH